MALFAERQRFLPITRQLFSPKARFDIGLALAHLVGFEHVVIKLLLINPLLGALPTIAGLRRRSLIQGLRQAAERGRQETPRDKFEIDFAQSRAKIIARIQTEAVWQ